MLKLLQGVIDKGTGGRLRQSKTKNQAKKDYERNKPKDGFNNGLRMDCEWI